MIYFSKKIEVWSLNSRTRISRTTDPHFTDYGPVIYGLRTWDSWTYGPVIHGLRTREYGHTDTDIRTRESRSILFGRHKFKAKNCAVSNFMTWAINAFSITRARDIFLYQRSLLMATTTFSQL